jgi:hypothetical protein
MKGLGEYIPTKSAGDNSRKKFTPYSLDDYKSLSKTHNVKLGGLGANYDENWGEKMKKNEKTKEFSKMIRGINSEKISKQVVKPKEVPKEVTTRDKALDYAKNVPKPKSKKREGEADPAPTAAIDGRPKQGKKENASRTNPQSEIDEEINQVEDDLDALEKQHQFYQQKINQLKS